MTQELHLSHLNTLDDYFLSVSNCYHTPPPLQAAYSAQNALDVGHIN